MDRTKNQKLCKFFMNGYCKKGDNCDFIHDKNFSREENYKHRNENKRHRRPKNTETFEPSHKPPDMRVIVENGGDKYPREYRSNDIIVVNNLFCNQDDMTIYEKLLGEIKDTKIDEHTFGNYGMEIPILSPMIN